MGFQYQQDAEIFRQAMATRLAKGNLRLHPAKTKLIEFGRFAQDNRAKQGKPKPESFDFLGFTHVCSKTRTGKRFAVRRITIAKRQRSKLAQIKQWLTKNCRIPIADQGNWVQRVINGSMNYYGVPGNLAALNALRTEVCKMWLKALRRRSQKAGKYTWQKFKHIVHEYVPSIRVVHPYPSERFCR